VADQLIPRQAKRKRQPTAECMRQQLVLAANRIIELETVLAHVKKIRGWDGPEQPRLSWWRRLLPRSWT
jgi:hypothetical protein